MKKTVPMSMPSENPLIMSAMYKADPITRFSKVCKQGGVPSDLFNWLKDIGLDQYCDLLVEAGLDDLEILQEMMTKDRVMPLTRSTLEEIGIHLPGH